MSRPVRAHVAVHLYRWGAEPRCMANMLAGLSADERLRAEAYRFERDRYQFVLCRHALRSALAEACSIAPERVAFDYGPQGRPRLRGAHGEIDFNLSHADGYAAIGISTAGPVGIDLEPAPQGDFDYDALVATVLTAQEKDELGAYAPERRAGRFLAYWTAKEACLKLSGMGLSMEPGHLQVSWPGDSATGRCAPQSGHTGPPPAVLTRVPIHGAICTLATLTVPDRLIVLTHALP